jgi:quinoprotein glucose dehydrogenase
VRQQFSAGDVTNISDSATAFVKEKIKGAKMGSIFTPPDTAGIVQFPGTRGGAEWGGASVDPETGILYVNANEIPLLIKMKAVPFDDVTSALSKGAKLYAVNNCTMCHGADRAGTSVFPSLQNISERLSAEHVNAVLKTGKGQMPAYPNLSAEDKKALIDFLFNRERKESMVKTNGTDTPVKYRYVHNGWITLTDKEGWPGVKPPWGTLNAIDLNKGEIRWQIPLGEYPELAKRGIHHTGTQNLGGEVVTAGGLIIIGATYDEKLRIFDKMDGTLLWEYKLPAGGYATPATYMVDGRQYIVIAAGGGGKVGSPSGDAYIAFRLKQ